MTDQTDNDLLARLNALRPSPVTLNTNPAVDVEVSQPRSTEELLSDRLKRLRNGQQIAADTEPANSPPRSIRTTATTDVDSDLAPWQMESHEQTVDELLAELEGNEQAQLDPDSQSDIKHLIQEARSMLPTEPQEPPTSFRSETPAVQDINDTNDSAADPDGVTEEREAEEYVQRVLAELEYEDKSAEFAAPDRGESIDQKATPSSTLPSPPDAKTLSDLPTYEDSELEARFSKLGLGLPSTPEGTPVSKKSQKAAASRKPPAFTDEDIDSWCVICNEDGEVRCLGCDNDIYCQTCWHEGHGNKPGQERGHKAVQYVKKGGGLAAAD